MSSKWLALWTLGLLCACGTDSAGTTADVVLSVHFDRPSHRVGKLIGWNIGAGSRYSPQGGSRHPEWRTKETTESLRRLSEIRPANGDRPVVRFSGLQIDGALGFDGYHFFDFADPQSEPMPIDNVAPFEYMAMVDEIDADPLIMLNFGSGTAEEASHYARHLVGTDENDPFVSARAFWGREEPWPVVFYEIANEIYESFNTGYSDTGIHSYANPEARNGGDPPWFGRPASSAQDYADRAIEYIDRVLEVQPDARFYIPLTQSTWTGWGGPEQSLPLLAPLLERSEVAGVVVHQYIIDDGQGGHGWDKAEDAWPLSSGDFYRPLFVELRTMLDALRRDEPLQITVTEYLGAALDPMGSVYAADLSVADMFLLYADVDVDLAIEHLTLAENPATDPIVRNWHKPFFTDSGTLRNRPAFEITKLLAEHLWHQVATIEPVELPTRRQALGDSGYDYDLVRSVAFISDSGESGSVILLNRDLEQERELEIILQNGETAVTVRGVAPQDLWADTLEVAGEVKPIPFEQVGTRLRMTLPAHSLTAVSVERPAR
jgi:hypothetical protein